MSAHCSASSARELPSPPFPSHHGATNSVHLMTTRPACWHLKPFIALGMVDLPLKPTASRRLVDETVLEGRRTRAHNESKRHDVSRPREPEAAQCLLLPHKLPASPNHRCRPCPSPDPSLSATSLPHCSFRSPALQGCFITQGVLQTTTCNL